MTQKNKKCTIAAQPMTQRPKPVPLLEVPLRSDIERVKEWAEEAMAFRQRQREEGKLLDEWDLTPDMSEFYVRVRRHWAVRRVIAPTAVVQQPCDVQAHIFANPTGVPDMYEIWSKVNSNDGNAETIGELQERILFLAKLLYDCHLYNVAIDDVVSELRQAVHKLQELLNEQAALHDEPLSKKGENHE